MFPNLSCLQLLDNDLRSLKELERLRPMVANLSAVGLGKNPITKTLSPAALRAFIKAQGPNLCLVQRPQRGSLSPDRSEERRNQRSPEDARSTPPRPKRSDGTIQAPPLPPASSQPRQFPSARHCNSDELIETDGAAHEASGGASPTLPGEREMGTAEADGRCQAFSAAAPDQESASSRSPGMEMGGVLCLSGERVDRQPVDERGARCGDGEEAAAEKATPRDGGKSAKEPYQGVGEEGRGALDSSLRPSDPLVGATLAASLCRAVRSFASSGGPSDPTVACAAYGADIVSAATEAAFVRLAEARKRAAGSSWGAVALEGQHLGALGVGSTSCDTSGGDAKDPGRAARAWATAARSAKLASNGIVSDRVRFCSVHGILTSVCNALIVYAYAVQQVQFTEIARGGGFGCE